MTAEFSIAAGGDDILLKYTGFAGRLANSTEMAEPVVFLNSNMASYISGALLAVDFGTAGLTERIMGGATFDMVKIHFFG
ncbi:hypothetical protein [Alkalibacter mobilis]|uniref:hypothetical protein n=1 Tax=Alkalibacter mobilis TaxID=2787712 RepID=UPI00189D55FD|nr:hypothetical protein [Alkalibacter mobilis]MBF7096832.1 hypothetical protein [Alkalibacter mobilis]